LDVNEESRKVIMEQFWRMMDWKEKMVYVLSLVDKKMLLAERRPMDQRLTGETVHTFKVKGEKVIVCKKMFLSTIGLNEKMVYNCLQSEEPGTSILSKSSAVASPMPSKARKSRYADTEKYANEYLESLPKVPSHYLELIQKRNT